MGQSSGITATTRKTKRFVEVLRVLASNGFDTFVERSRLIAVVEGGWSKLNHRPAPTHDPLPLAERLRLVCEELGATFVKLGQVLSTRPDLIPPEVVLEFKKLQHDVSKVPFEVMEERLNAAYPEGYDQWFQSIDPTPIAAASIAQVHRATLKDGQVVVLKVIKPGIENTIRGDLGILRDLAELAGKYFENLGFDPSEVVEEFARHLEIELDLIHEGQATERLARYFEDDDSVRFPQVHWKASRKKVLALEEIKGIQLSRLDPATLAPETREHLCQLATKAIFRMCLEFGYFHADPHPGNLFLDEEKRLVLIDCGMTGFVESRTRYLLGEFVRAVIDRHLDRTVRVAIEITNADPALEKDRHFRNDLWEMIGRCEAGTLDGLDFTALLNHFFDVLRKYRIHCPGDLVYLIKALMTMEGVVEEIEPNFDLVGAARPLLKRLFAQHYG
ncbi:MAG: ABC1 kinase family protein, partial [Verrucomicrobiales bacterium]